MKAIILWLEDPIPARKWIEGEILQCFTHRPAQILHKVVKLSMFLPHMRIVGLHPHFNEFSMNFFNFPVTVSEFPFVQNHKTLRNRKSRILHITECGDILLTKNNGVYRIAGQSSAIGIMSAFG